MDLMEYFAILWSWKVENIYLELSDANWFLEFFEAWRLDWLDSSIEPFSEPIQAFHDSSRAIQTQWFKVPNLARVLFGSSTFPRQNVRLKSGSRPVKVIKLLCYG